MYDQRQEWNTQICQVTKFPLCSVMFHCEYSELSVFQPGETSPSEATDPATDLDAGHTARREGSSRLKIIINLTKQSWGNIVNK